MYNDKRKMFFNQLKKNMIVNYQQDVDFKWKKDITVYHLHSVGIETRLRHY